MKGLIRSLGRAAPLEQWITKRTIPLTDKTMTMTGATGVGWGTVVLEGLPEANILVLGLVLDATFTEASGDIVDTFDGDVSLGTAPTTDNTLSGAEVDILASTAIPQATAGVASLRAPLAVPLMLDNTDGAGEINLNMLIDDADISGDTGVITLSGALYLVYVTLGDD